MQKSLEDPPRRKNASLQMRTIEKLKDLNKKITKGWRHLEDPRFIIRNHAWK